MRTPTARRISLVALLSGLAVFAAATAAFADGGTPTTPTTTTLTTTAPTATAPAADPLRGCDHVNVPSIDWQRLCPTVSLNKVSAVVKRGKTIIFRGRVADASKFFIYGFSVLHGDKDGRPVADSTLMTRSQAVVYPTLRWKAKAAGSYTVCVVGGHGASPSPTAYACAPFIVR